MSTSETLTATETELKLEARNITGRDNFEYQADAGQIAKTHREVRLHSPQSQTIIVIV